MRRAIVIAVVAMVGGLGLPVAAAQADRPPPGVAGSANLVPPVRGPAVQVGPTLPPPMVPVEERLPAGSGTGRRIVYANRAQRVWAVDEDETVIKTHLVSGRIGNPRTGVYSVWSRSASTCATTNPSVCWRWMVRFAIGVNGGNVGFHEIPRRNGRPVQSESQLGQPLSSGCVRQGTADALWMWEWAELGTVVVVLP